MSTARPEGRFGVVHVLVISGNVFGGKQQDRIGERREKGKKDIHMRMCALLSIDRNTL